jgi:hypothetical protein
MLQRQMTHILTINDDPTTIKCHYKQISYTEDITIRQDNV